jgi:hypothetical protein
MQGKFKPFFKNYVSLRLMRTHITIFNKSMNNNYKIIPFNVKVNNVGEIKYLPPASKE